jgi:CBS domain-containing protein
LTFGILYARIFDKTGKTAFVESIYHSSVSCSIPERRQCSFERLINREDPMRVGQILAMKGTRIISIRLRESVAAAVKLMVTENIGAVVVTDVVLTEGSTVVGMLSERDLMRALLTNGQDIMKMPVEKLMTKKLISCEPNDDLADVMEKMDRYGIRHLPVLDEHTLVGVLSVRDVIHVLRGAVAGGETVAPAA